jgi:hypothetical protein
MRWFIRVDLPTFGRPIIATNPDLKSGVMKIYPLLS